MAKIFIALFLFFIMLALFDIGADLHRITAALTRTP